jgi:hypothetical protein
LSEELKSFVHSLTEFHVEKYIDHLTECWQRGGSSATRPESRDQSINERELRLPQPAVVKSLVCEETTCRAYRIVVPFNAIESTRLEDSAVSDQMATGFSLLGAISTRSTRCARFCPVKRDTLIL